MAPIDLASVKAGHDIAALVMAYGVALTRRGGDHWGRCPFHPDGSPSFKVSTARQAFHCFGCGAKGDVIDFVSRIERLDLIEAARRLQGAGPVSTPPRPPAPRYQAREEAEARAKIEAARRLWSQGQPVAGTAVDAYLRSRGLTGPFPDTLRYHAGLDHHASGLKLPAMIGAVTRWPDRAVIGLHRTYLAPEGRKAPVSPVKMALGGIAGGAVRLAPAGPVLIVAEGIETALSVAEASGLPAWAALNAGNLSRLMIPDETREVIIAADHDDNGTGQREAEKAAHRWHQQGRIVRVVLPERPGLDWLDVITGQDIQQEADHD